MLRALGLGAIRQLNRAACSFTGKLPSWAHGGSQARHGAGPGATVGVGCSAELVVLSRDAHPALLRTRQSGAVCRGRGFPQTPHARRPLQPTPGPSQALSLGRNLLHARHLVTSLHRIFITARPAPWLPRRHRSRAITTRTTTRRRRPYPMQTTNSASSRRIPRSRMQRVTRHATRMPTTTRPMTATSMTARRASASGPCPSPASCASSAR